MPTVMTGPVDWLCLLLEFLVVWLFVGAIWWITKGASR